MDWVKVTPKCNFVDYPQVNVSSTHFNFNVAASKIIIGQGYKYVVFYYKLTGNSLEIRLSFFNDRPSTGGAYKVSGTLSNVMITVPIVIKKLLKKFKLSVKLQPSIEENDWLLTIAKTSRR